jgi:hypothetical protein
MRHPSVKCKFDKKGILAKHSYREEIIITPSTLKYLINVILFPFNLSSTSINRYNIPVQGYSYHN